MGKILRVDLSSGSISDEDLPPKLAEKYIGGAGLGTYYLMSETQKGVDPLGPDNPLVFMTGPLTGTVSPSAARYSIVTKSPLTESWGHANSGGSFGPALKKSGYDGIIFRGCSSVPRYLSIQDGKVELLDASHIWGKTVPETEHALKNEHGKKTTVASIGPAGENLVRYAGVMNNIHRTAGRCGVGAVMGSKKLKAVIVSGSESIVLADKDAFRSKSKKQFELINESLLKIGFETFGTAMVADMVNVKGGYPTRNWQSGVFEKIDEVNAQAITERLLNSRESCFACPIACGRGTEIKDGNWKGSSGEGPEYETSNTFGAMCGVSDLNAIAKANYLCNEYGLDTISAGATIAFALECFEKGILTKEETFGEELNFGDGDMVVKLVEKIAKRDGIGDLLAEGSRLMAKRLGNGSEAFAMNVKGLEMPAYDPRAAKILGLAYATANRGGDHVTSLIFAPTFVDSPILVVEDSHIKDPYESNPEEAKIVADMENAATVFDCLGGCKFMGLLLKAEDYVDLISSATGWDMSVEDFRRGGERVYNLMRAFCVREGFGRDDDILPKRLMEDPLPEGPAKGMVVEAASLDRMKDVYYEYRGWNKESGSPTDLKLKELGLDEITGKMQ